jgi:PAS domain S-box-containing protein
MIWSTRPDGYHDYFNQRWYEYTGTTPEEMEGWGWQSVHDPAELPHVLERWQRSIATGEPFDMVFPLRSAGGKYSSFLTRVSPTFDNAGAVTGWYGINTDISAQLKAERERSLVAQELSHRIKNLFSVILALVAISKRRFPEAKSFANDLVSRISALSRSHDFVDPKSEKKDDSSPEVTLQALIARLIAPYTEGERITISGDDVRIKNRATTPLSLLFHELATNSVKYGAMSNAIGRVTIALSASDDSIQMIWQEHAGPPVVAPSRFGFGSFLAQMSVEQQLDGTLSNAWIPDGLVVTAVVPTDVIATRL